MRYLLTLLLALCTLSAFPSEQAPATQDSEGDRIVIIKPETKERHLGSAVIHLGQSVFYQEAHPAFFAGRSESAVLFHLIPKRSAGQ